MLRMPARKTGLWLIGAFGGVGTTVALGLAALRRGLTTETGLVTGLEMLRGLDLDSPADFIIGGHDIRRTDFVQGVREFQQRSNVFEPALVEPCVAQLQEWAQNVRPGTVLNSGETIARLADMPGLQMADTPRSVIDLIQADLRAFRDRFKLDQLIVVNLASTEPPFALSEVHQDVAQLMSHMSRPTNSSPPSEGGVGGVGPVAVLPASGLYAWAALELGLPYINFTPSLGASFPAALNVAQEKRTVIAGKDGKTGETLLKTVLAPMFAHRNLRVLSWVGHNIFGNRDAVVLNDPRNKESKVRTKDKVLGDILGYKPQSLVSIEYIESLDDWKTAWDHIHFQGFLGVKMAMQFTWQGCDSLLAAPLVIDLARLTLLAHRHGETGILRHLACFWKNPMGVEEHDFFKQWGLLEEWVRNCCAK
jgi:myo-inositol-1-phosphate synthase